MIRSFLVFAFAQLLISNAALALSPPWYAYWSVVKSTLGADACVESSELTRAKDFDGFEGTIKVCNLEKAAALARLVGSEKNAGARIRINFVDAQSKAVSPEDLGEVNPERVVQLIHRALKENRYFAASEMGSAGFGGKMVWVEFKPSVISLWADNISDKYGRINYIAATAFDSVLGLKELAAAGFSVRVTTRPENR